MVDFAGWLMPVQYDGVLKEHEYVRTHAGIFDISHMGEFYLVGEDAIKFLQYMVTNDLKLLENGKSQYSVMCYPNGTVVDDLIYYQESSTQFRIIVNASNVKKDFEWFQSHISQYQVSLTDLSSSRARFAFQGPEAQKILQPLVNTDLTQIKRFYFRLCELSHISIFLTRTGYTGEDGFELSCNVNDSERIWKELINTGAKPIGLGARDSLRLEACYSLYGHEINDHINPVEGNIGWVVKPKDGIDYIGKEILLKQKKDGTDRILVGLDLLEKGIMRDHYRLLKNNDEIGFVTSGGYSPTLKKSIALGLVNKEYSSLNTQFEIEIRNKRLPVKVVSTPFYKR
jgi:aminomethyltransferase